MSDTTVQNRTSGSAWALIQELASDRIHKWGECQAMPEAVAKVISDHPDLYDRYLVQQQATSEKEERQRSDDAAVAWSKIKAKANDMIAKDEAKTFAQGVTAVVDAEPGLYDTYRAGV